MPTFHVAMCPAGQQESMDGTLCEDCPVDTYKSMEGPSHCTPCNTSDGTRRVTVGLTGATAVTQCKGSMKPQGTIVFNFCKKSEESKENFR